MTDTKPPLRSRTIWAGILAILAGLPVVIQAVLYWTGVTPDPVTPEELSTAGLSMVAGIATIWGRRMATTRIAATAWTPEPEPVSPAAERVQRAGDAPVNQDKG